MTVHYLEGPARQLAEDVIKEFHPLHSVPSGKSHYFQVDHTVICYTIPANKNIARFLLGEDCVCWELSRICHVSDDSPRAQWVDAIRESCTELTELEPVRLLVAYADPNRGEEGDVYRACAWFQTGRSEEQRAYFKDGQLLPRRKFHSGGKQLTKRQILRLGYRELKLPGKDRFAYAYAEADRERLQMYFSASG